MGPAILFGREVVETVSQIIHDLFLLLLLLRQSDITTMDPDLSHPIQSEAPSSRLVSSSLLCSRSASHPSIHPSTYNPPPPPSSLPSPRFEKRPSVRIDRISIHKHTQLHHSILQPLCMYVCIKIKIKKNKPSHPVIAKRRGGGERRKEPELTPSSFFFGRGVGEGGEGEGRCRRLRLDLIGLCFA